MFWLYCLSCSACLVLLVFFYLPVLPVLFCLSCSDCPVLPVVFWLSSSGFPVLAVLSWPYIYCIIAQVCEITSAKIKEHEKSRNARSVKSQRAQSAIACSKMYALKRARKRTRQEFCPGARRLKKVCAQLCKEETVKAGQSLGD
jgi:hypothetical protein